jgi:H+-transporting ATPase
MLELIMVLSAVLGKYSDLIVVGALLVINAVLSFMQEQPGRRCRGGAAKTVAGQCARPARFELAGHSRPGIGSRRHRSRATRRHHSGGRETPHGSVERGPVGAHRRIEGRGQSAGEVLSSGSVVRRGEGNGVVMLTGAKTYFGRTTQLVQEARPKLHIEAVVAKSSAGSSSSSARCWAW